LRFANAVAALKCRDLGGRKGIPSLEEVQKLLHG
jgi:sugar/nucleoside kinase (ribokinase family)